MKINDNSVLCWCFISDIGEEIEGVVTEVWHDFIENNIEITNDGLIIKNAIYELSEKQKEYRKKLKL